MRYAVLHQLDADQYQRHALHAEECVWVEKNCYVDVCIELLHSLGLDPYAMLGSCASVNFEGDNFTFYKPSHEDLRALYGVDFQELNIWRPLADHAVEHVRAGKFLSTEADAHYLPDTAGTDYRRNHVKTTIVIADIDVTEQKLGYFHNAGYFRLEGDDFVNLFRLGKEPDPAFMPFFAEIVRVESMVQHSSQQLAISARKLLVRNMARRPQLNPIRAFKTRFDSDIGLIQERGLAYYHAWAFATVRQMGAVYELFALHLKWLADNTQTPALNEASQEFKQISVSAKTLILKVARGVNSKKAFDVSTLLEEMASSWDKGMALVTDELNAPALAQHA